MKNINALIILNFILLGCTINKKPIFVKFGNIELKSFKTDTIKIKAVAFFRNNNDIGGKISTDEIKVFINEKEIAKLSSNEFKVPKHKEFSIPLNVIIPTNKILDKGNGDFLVKLINLALNNNLKVRFKGVIKYKFLGFSSSYSIDKTKYLKIRL